MILNKKLIKELSAGEIALTVPESDSEFHKVHTILEEAFPKDMDSIDYPFHGEEGEFILKDSFRTGDWKIDGRTDLPTKTIGDFFKPIGDEDLDSKLDKLKKELKTLQRLKDERDAKPKFEQGKWYINGNGSCAYCIKTDKKNLYGYGIDNLGRFVMPPADVYWGDFDNPSLADETLVNTLLKKEAEKRGYKDGTTIVDVDGDEEMVRWSGAHYTMSGNFLELGCAIVFKNGKWASPKPASGLPKVNGYDGSDAGDCIKYGCAYIPKVFFQPKVGNRTISNFTLETSGVTFTKEDINKIKEYLDEQ